MWCWRWPRVSFNGFDKSPSRQGIKRLPKLFQFSIKSRDSLYEQLCAAHIADYQKTIQPGFISFGRRQFEQSLPIPQTDLSLPA